MHWNKVKKNMPDKLDFILLLSLIFIGAGVAGKFDIYAALVVEGILLPVYLMLAARGVFGD